MFIPFTKYRYNAIFNKQSPLAKFNTVSFAQLLSQPVILMPTTQLHDFNPYKILSHFGTVNLRLADSYDLYDQFLIDGLGVTITPDIPLINKESNSLSGKSNIISRPISDNVYGTMGYIYNKNNENPYVKQFLNIFDNN